MTLKGHNALRYGNRAVLWYHRIGRWQLPIGCQ